MSLMSLRKKIASLLNPESGIAKRELAEEFFRLKSEKEAFAKQRSLYSCSLNRKSFHSQTF
jgi:hypothetical protein